MWLAHFDQLGKALRARLTGRLDELRDAEVLILIYAGDIFTRHHVPPSRLVDAACRLAGDAKWVLREPLGLLLQKQKSYSMAFSHGHLAEGIFRRGQIPLRTAHLNQPTRGKQLVRLGQLDKEAGTHSDGIFQRRLEDSLPFQTAPSIKILGVIVDA